MPPAQLTLASDTAECLAAVCRERVPGKGFDGTIGSGHGLSCFDREVIEKHMDLAVDFARRDMSLARQMSESGMLAQVVGNLLIVKPGQ